MTDLEKFNTIKLNITQKGVVDPDTNSYSFRGIKYLVLDGGYSQVISSQGRGSVEKNFDDTLTYYPPMTSESLDTLLEIVTPD